MLVLNVMDENTDHLIYESAYRLASSIRVQCPWLFDRRAMQGLSEVAPKRFGAPSPAAKTVALRRITSLNIGFQSGDKM
jgi:hypothetical protein